MTTQIPSKSEKKEPFLLENAPKTQEESSSMSPNIVQPEQIYHFRRWFILCSFCFLTFVNGVTLVIYSAIIEEAKAYYTVSDTQILWFVWQFNITYVIISFPVGSLT